MATVILFAMLPFFKFKWPEKFWDYIHISVVAVLLHCVYLGAIFAAIDQQLPASTASIIVGLQPLVTVLLAMRWLDESLTTLKLLGLILGFVGIVFVIGQQGLNTGGFNIPGIALSITALLGISIGTVYQKKFCGSYDLLPSVCIQFVVNAIVMIAMAFALETRVVTWGNTFILALAWLVVVLSIGTTLLLLWLIRQGEAGSIASLFYLVPPFVIVQAWILFDETFTLLALIGILACIIGVAMVVRQQKPA